MMIKKHIHYSLRTLILFLSVFLSLPMLAIQVEIDGINYELINKVQEATVVAKSSGKYSGDIVIPKHIEYNGNGYEVTSIEQNAFSECYDLLSATIGNSVVSIGEKAFKACYGLTSVTFGNSITSIGQRAFEGCTSLTSVHISDLSAWCSIRFGDNAANPLSYTHHLYVNGKEVSDLVIPNSVTSIEPYAFYGCAGLTSLYIPNSVTVIGGEAFYGCTGLTSIDLPNSISILKDGSFRNCSALTSVSIPNGVWRIGMRTFQGCSALTSIIIPHSVQNIEYCAFEGCI